VVKNLFPHRGHRNSASKLHGTVKNATSRSATTRNALSGQLKRRTAKPTIVKNGINVTIATIPKFRDLRNLLHGCE
jgi:hypothetical protein